MDGRRQTDTNLHFPAVSSKHLWFSALSTSFRVQEKIEHAQTRWLSVDSLQGPFSEEFQKTQPGQPYY